jgi:hypothetical protein
MKLSWLLPALLGGGAAADLDKVSITVGNKVLGVESRVLVGKGITYEEQQQNGGASIHSASANALPVTLDTLNIALPNQNQTKPCLNVHQREAAEDTAPIITFKTTTNPPPNSEDPSTQRTDPSAPDHDPDIDDGSSTDSSKRAETRNPASANRAIAGMGVGLVSVFLIFTVFL